MEDVFSPADLIVRPQRSFTGQDRPTPSQRARCVALVGTFLTAHAARCRRGTVTLGRYQSKHICNLRSSGN